MSVPCRLFWFGPPLLLMGLIFWLGGDVASAGQTQTLLLTVLRWLLLPFGTHLSQDALLTINFYFRKSGHFLGYALLGILNARALRGLRGSMRGHDAGAAWAAATAWAAVDEYHQSFAGSRGAAVEDVVLDAAGAAAGIAAYFLWTRQRTRND